MNIYQAAYAKKEWNHRKSQSDLLPEGFIIESSDGKTIGFIPREDDSVMASHAPDMFRALVALRAAIDDEVKVIYDTPKLDHAFENARVMIDRLSELGRDEELVNIRALGRERAIEEYLDRMETPDGTPVFNDRPVAGDFNYLESKLDRLSTFDEREEFEKAYISQVRFMVRKEATR